ncbi:hydroxymethylbilane synthase [Rubrobacter marinus]|uniref:Porphobilinogen deaminase n=1 Tax=Rubrobacter marinus TaxID=2653852 RepID=A0A6G8PVN1_9ACTN|nr:hydroxymethylbilane synthase [Rubrobacter marinus]QIN78262.1 hydroxymethylbilane synthase [Rubrobacter marinus]
MSRSGPAVLGTRGSKLALVQANACAEKLRAVGLEVEVRIIKTTSEQQPDTPLRVIDRRDVFTRQLDEALLAGEIDLAVHSLKDVPTELPEGIVLAAISERHDPSDALVSDGGLGVDGLPQGAVVATSSLRRRAQLLHRRPDLEIAEIRGNVDTRVRKMRDGAADALVLARAGLKRLGLDGDVPHTVLGPETMLPAVGQGSLAVATLADHALRGEIRAALNHEPSETAAYTERALLNELEGGCRVPVGALAIVRDGGIRLQGLVASPDGALLYRDAAEGTEADEVGRRLARELLGRGAGVILDEIREVRS